MISINQIIVQWENSKCQVKIQSKTGIKGDYLKLNDQNARVSGNLEINNSEKVPFIKYSPNKNLFHPILLREESTYFLTVLIPEREKKRVISEGVFIDRYVNQFVQLFPPHSWKETVINDEEYIEIYGEIKTNNFVGILNLSIGNEQQFFCEVAARKIGYEADYRYFLNEIAQESNNLLMQFGGMSHLKFTSNEKSPSDFSKIMQLRSIMNELPLAIDTILNKLHNKLETNLENRLIGKGKYANIDITKMITKPYTLDLQYGGILQEKFKGYTPKRIIVKNKTETIDTPENRFVKHILEELQYNCFLIKRNLEVLVKNDNKNKIYLIYISEINGWLSIIQDYLSTRIFMEISKIDFFPSNSQVLQRSSGYQDILIIDIRLHNGLLLSWNPLEAITSDVYAKPVYELYEIWCFFILRNILRDILGPEINSIISTNNRGSITFNLKKGVLSCLLFKKKELRVKFFYNKDFRQPTKVGGSYSLNFKPDYSLYFYNDKDIKKGYYVHFDAKYKVDELKHLNSDKKSSKKQDIIKMHAYKDGIVNTLGSYVLYPGNEFKIFSENSEILPGVGAIPVKPNDEGSLNQLKTFIEGILEYVKVNEMLLY
ncbi:putative component of viral defense system (DUF524 family) [Peribacillus frigoritolerans]|uniref:DUF2357 domain-containing protein n=1 Tax=Peribacillus frigoritolerans TaxID=450367 RepID=UPI0011997174|nr:DUF2357 domain-containing protein [Peribacillus frigoritolerans]TWE03640.1 putative component of viral defense system (DUF524 family) [Peribacillus frigoritolerans]